MGCGISTPQQQEDQNRSPNNKLLSCLIRRRVDSIRRRRKRVGDSITMETTLSTKLLLNADKDDKTMKMSSCCKAEEEEEEKEINDERHVVVIKAVCRAIEDVLLSEEREYAELQLLNNDTSVSSKDVVKTQMYVPQSPSFRVYCTRVESFDTNSSTKDNDDVVKDVKHERCKSMDTGSSEEEDGSTRRSSKSKMGGGGQKGEITKKAGSNWRLGSPLGMKNLFVMSCYSCSPQNRDRLLSRG